MKMAPLDKYLSSPYKAATSGDNPALPH